VFSYPLNSLTICGMAKDLFELSNNFDVLPSDIFLFLVRHREYAATNRKHSGCILYDPWAATTANILAVCEAPADQPETVKSRLYS